MHGVLYSRTFLSSLRVDVKKAQSHGVKRNLTVCLGRFFRFLHILWNGSGLSNTKMLRVWFGPISDNEQVVRFCGKSCGADFAGPLRTVFAYIFSSGLE